LKSQYDSKSLCIEPAVEMAMKANDRRGFQRPIRPEPTQWDFDAILDTEIQRSLEILSERGSKFGFLKERNLEKYIEWAKQHSPRNRSAIASKLRAFADLDRIGRNG